MANEIHKLVRIHGRQGAKQLQPQSAALIDIAADLLAEESTETGYVYSGFCLTALPHKRLPDETPWERIALSGRLKLTIIPGYLTSVSHAPQRVGVPYGARARLILLYLQSQAIKSQCPEIELGRSMREWLGRMGLSIGGQTYIDVRDQARRLTACDLRFTWNDDNGDDQFEKGSIVTRGTLSFNTGDDRNGSLFPEKVTLSDQFFKAISNHPVPLWEPAIKALSNKSLALDIYIWLAYRLHVFTKPTSVSWSSVFGQFGAGFSPSSIRRFRQFFKEALTMALTVYEGAKVEVTADGLILHPSRPPVARLDRT